MSTQSIIESIISPKIVSSGTGYVAKTDIANVDMIQHSDNQCGSVTFASSGNPTSAVVSVTGVKTTSIIMITPGNDWGVSRYWVTPSTNQFTITTVASSPSVKFYWFVAKY